MPRWVLALVVVPAVLTVGLFLAVGRWVLPAWYSIRSTDRNQRVLLYRTNHGAVRAAAYTVMSNRVKYPKDDYAGNDPALPAPIRNLKAARIWNGGDHLQIEFGGGFFHYGYWIWRPGEKDQNPAASNETARELLPGMWYRAESSSLPSKN